jgi:hypothetical protein
MYVLLLFHCHHPDYVSPNAHVQYPTSSTTLLPYLAFPFYSIANNVPTQFIYNIFITAL